MDYSDYSDCLKLLNFIYQGNKEMYLTRKYERYEQFTNVKTYQDCVS